MKEFYKTFAAWHAAVLAPLAVLYFFDKPVAVGLFVLLALSSVTLAILHSRGFYDKKLYAIIFLVLAAHTGMVLFIHYSAFNPFPGGADSDGYNRDAIEIAGRLRHFNFSLTGIPLLHYFPVVIGVVYAFTVPAMVVGQLFLVWFAVLAMVTLYFLVLEIRGSAENFLPVGIAALYYPSFLYFGSLLLKDSLVVLLVLVGLLLTVKILQRCTWQLFLLFFLVATAVTHLRFYIGFALIFSFMISWLLISSSGYKKRLAAGAVMLLLLGFCPQITGLGYYGSRQFSAFLNIHAITNYREVAYAPAPASVAPEDGDSSTPAPTPGQEPVSGTGSSFVVDVGEDNPFAFVVNNATSFAYGVFGPFFWQFKQQKHLLFLAETIPWNVAIILVIFAAWRQWKNLGWREFAKAYRLAVPLLLFSLLAMGAIAVFINNFGILARIRMPALMSMFCLLSFGNYSFFSHVWNRWTGKS